VPWRYNSGWPSADSIARRPSLILLVAATAEINHHTVLHVDKDFELIADLTGQAVERLNT